MRVKAIKDYYDLVLQKDIITGEEYEVADARGKALTTAANNAGCALCVEIPVIKGVEKPIIRGKKVDNE